MSSIYNILISLFNRILPVIGLLSPKLKLFVTGRKSVFETLKNNIKAEDQEIWFHCASLGEYEQGVPVMQELKKKHPTHKLLVTFFSPSGYEAKKNSNLADIPTVVISAAFREDQVFFKWYGGFVRKALDTVAHFFVQDRVSLALLKKEEFTNATLSGDTRFDRVSHQIEMDNHVDFISEFIEDRLCYVIGSSWPEDEEVFIDYINTAPDDICFVIAPHEIKTAKIAALQQKIEKKTIAYSKKDTQSVKGYQVFIMDTVGYLSRAYSYGDIAYVGGAMGTSGLHNILEPATFGIPIIIGKNFEKFREAKQLQKLAGLYSIATAEEFTRISNKLVVNKKFREKTGMIAGHFINSNTGATGIIMDYLDTLLTQKLFYRPFLVYNGFP